jgi:uncharacterized protein with GYD domain
MPREVLTSPSRAIHVRFIRTYKKGGGTMPKYISLVKYTSKGIENIKESPNRLDAVKQLNESMGARVDAFYLTMGQYDIVMIVDAPNAATAAKIILKISSGGNVSTETLTAFSEEEYRNIISELP